MKCKKQCAECAAYRRKYKISSVTSEVLRTALEEQGYTIIEFNGVDDNENVRILKDLLGLAPYMEQSRGFTYRDKKYRLVFVNEALNEEERQIVLAHEQGHIWNDHMEKDYIFGNDVVQEYEANEFVHYLMKYKKGKMRGKWMGCALAGILICIALVSGILLYRNREQVVYTDLFYVAGSGTKYHQKGCMYIRDRKDVRRLTEEEFISGKYEPCDICLPGQNYKVLQMYTNTKDQKTDDIAKQTSAREQTEDPTELEMVSNPTAVILESDCDVEIAKAGFTISNGYIHYAIVLHNNSGEKAIEYLTYRFTAKDENGVILGTGDQVLNVIYPGQDYVWGGIGCEVPEMPALVEFEVLNPEDCNIKNTSQLSHPEYKPLKVQNVNCRVDQFSGYKFLGEVYNSNDYDISQAGVFVVLKNETGAIIGGEMTFVDNIRAESKAAFEIDYFDETLFSDYELYANSWM